MSVSLSVASAEAGLLAAPWDEAKRDDKALFAAAKSLTDQTSDLTQRGARDHPTDRAVLYDIAATLALELAADGDHRARVVFVVFMSLYAGFLLLYVRQDQAFMPHVLDLVRQALPPVHTR